MHEDFALDCVLGCRGCRDSLSHYVHCPHMFAFQRFLFDNISERPCDQKGGVLHKSISDDPLIRFGIKGPEFFTLKVLSWLFSAYHALEGDIRSGRIIMHSSGWLNASWSVSAHAIKAEAVELHLATRAFSLPQFMQFILNGGTHCLAISSHACDPH